MNAYPEWVSASAKNRLHRTGHRAYSGDVRELTTCQYCHRYIAPDFAYCPYCGKRRVESYEFRKLLDTPFERMEQSVQEYSMRRLEVIEQQLQSLEVDLQHLIDDHPAARA